MAGKASGKFDLVLRGGRVIDPARKFDGVRDVAVRNGKIAAIANTIPARQAKSTVDVSGQLVLPGLIDVHAHVYQYVSGPFGLDPDIPGVRSGATTVVDAGGASALTFDGFRKFIAERATSRVLAYISTYLAGGLYGHMESGLYGPYAIDVDLVIRSIEANRDLVKGVKVHAEAGGYSRWGLNLLTSAKQISRAVDLPVYVHLGHMWPLAGKRKVDADRVVAKSVALLDAGDVLAHPFSHWPGCFVTRQGKVNPAVLEAVQRGVRVDVGRGLHFSFNNARTVLDAGIMPTTLGVDLHGYIIDPKRLRFNVREIRASVGETRPRSRGGAKSAAPPARASVTICHAMSELLALGVSLTEVVRMVTSNAASLLGIERDCGTLRVGRAADISVIDLEEGCWTLRDFSGNAVTATQYLTPAWVLRDGIRYQADMRVPTVPKSLAA